MFPKFHKRLLKLTKAAGTQVDSKLVGKTISAPIRIFKNFQISQKDEKVLINYDLMNSKQIPSELENNLNLKIPEFESEKRNYFSLREKSDFLHEQTEFDQLQKAASARSLNKVDKQTHLNNLSFSKHNKQPSSGLPNDLNQVTVDQTAGELAHTPPAKRTEFTRASKSPSDLPPQMKLNLKEDNIFF